MEYYNMDSPNIPINIFLGNVKVIPQKHPEQWVILNGKLFYEWLPNTRLMFEGKPVDGYMPFMEIMADSHLDLYMDGFKIGIAKLLLLSKEVVRIYIYREAVLGDKSIEADELLFEIPNYFDFPGDEIILEDDNYLITIKKKPEFYGLLQSLRLTGGFLLNCHGNIKRKDGHITFDQFHGGGFDLFGCLRNFLSFLNGQQTTPMFIKAFKDGELVWTDLPNYNISRNSSETYQWCNSASIAGIKDLWAEFRKLWVKDSFATNYFIHWYCESNINKGGFIDSNIVLIQNALELLINIAVEIFERIEPFQRNVPTYRKLEILLESCGVDILVPDFLPELYAHASSENNSGPQSITKVRNALTHSESAKRELINNMDKKAQFQTLHLAISYTVLVFLNLLGFNEKYKNIYTKEVKYVPWCETL